LSETIFALMRHFSRRNFHSSIGHRKRDRPVKGMAMSWPRIARMDTMAIVAIAMALNTPPAAALDETLKAVTASTLTLTSSSAVVVLPATVTVTATVGGTMLKGNVTFRSGAANVGVATISKNAAVATLTLPAAVHTLTAVFTTSDGTVVSAPIRVVVDNALSCG
jgi:hypothetical protein